MDDLDDVLEAVDELEDLVEEVADPEDLVEDALAEPLTVIAALAAAAMAAFGVLALLLTAVLLVFALGLVRAVAAIAVLSIALSLVSFGAFLYLRTDVPDHVQAKIDEALARADQTTHEDASMTDEEAIDVVREQYAEGELDDRELERRLEAIMESEDPGAVVRRDHDRDRERTSRRD